MYGIHAVLILLHAAVHGSQAVPDCCALGFGTTEPQSAADASLTVCTNASQQCCTSFVEQFFIKAPVQSELEQFLTIEYQDGINDTLDKIERLLSYFYVDFSTDHLDALPFNTSHPTIQDSGRILMASLQDTQSDICTLYPEHIKVVVEIFARDVSSEDEQCVNRTTYDSIDREIIDKVSNEIVKVQRIVKTLKEIYDFLRSQENRTQGATVEHQCVDGFIRAAFCRQCIERTPPLCLHTCNALLRGCYSPYYTVLNQQFSDLWMAIGRGVSIANATVTSIILNAGKIVTFPTLVSELRDRCKISSDISTEISKQQRVGIPPNLVTELTSLTGPFQYGRSNLQFCQYYLQNNACTVETNQGTQEMSCPVEDPTQLKNDTYTCNPEDICTSECDCFDGVDFTTNTNTTRVFNKNDVDDQGTNPSFIPPLNVTELISKVSRLRNGSDPVAAFLESSNLFKDDYTGPDVGCVTVATDDKPTDDKPTDDKPTDDKPTDDKPTDDKPTDDKPTDAKPTDGSTCVDNGSPVIVACLALLFLFYYSCSVN